MKRNFQIAVCLVSAAFGSQSWGQISPQRSAQTVETITGLDLALNEPPTPADYAMAMHMLSMAQEMDPQNTDLARSIIQAAWSAGDHEQMIQATRVVVRNDPSDTVAQLRLISAIINREQTVEGRIAGYERFLGESGESIDPSVRSRLSMDMALLERDRGNEQGFLVALRQAAKLDTANKEAQSLVAQHYSRMIQDSPTLMRLQLRVLRADPLDPHVHISIARLCAAEGATDAAWRFLNNGIQIFRIDSGVTPPILQEQQLSLLWQHEGAQAILDELNPALADDRNTMQSRIEARIEANEPIDDLIDPGEIRYDPGIDRIRLMAASFLDDQESVDSVLIDLRRSLIAFHMDIKEQMEVRGADKGALLGLYLGEVISFQTMRAIAGVDAKVIEEDISSIVDRSPALERFFRPLEPFSLFAAGKFEEAKETAVSKLARSAPRDLLIALSTEKLGLVDEAIEIYKQLMRDYPLDATGAVARSRLMTLTNSSDLITPEGKILQEIADGIPEWYDRMITQPENTMMLNIESVKSSYQAGEPAELIIRLANLSTLPLSLGSSHPIDSNLLIIPGYREVATDFRGTGGASVVDMGRRLRLKPLEEIEIRVNPDSIRTRWLIEMQPQTTIRQRWRGLQGFKQNIGGGIVNSPFALISETPLVERVMLNETQDSLEQLIDGINSTDAQQFRRSVTAAASILLKPSFREDLEEADRLQITNALWDRYVSADTPTKVWMLGILPTKLASSSMAMFDERAQQSLVSDSLLDLKLEPVLVAMVMLTRVETMDSPVFEVARSHADERLGFIANLLVERIEKVEPMYAGTDQPFVTFTPTRSQDTPGF